MNDPASCSRTAYADDNDAANDLAGVSFDATGTLFWCPGLGAIYSSILTRHGLEVGAETALVAFRDAWQEFDCLTDPKTDRWAAHPQGAKGWWGDLIRRVCALAGQGEPTDFAIAELFHRFRQADAWEVYPEVGEVLGSLKDLGVPAIVTSNWDKRLHEVLINLGLAHHFVAVVCSEDVGSAKPGPAIFDAAHNALRA